MRFVLFYSSVESFNYFTNEITKELHHRGHETFILDLENLSGQDTNTGKLEDGNNHSLPGLTSFLSAPIDMVIAYDGLGIKQDMFVDLWNTLHVLCVNILMDHPLRFHETMNHHPHNYIQFCCDYNHINYVKSFFSDKVSDVRFLSHAGTVQNFDAPLSDASRLYDILFCGTYYNPDSYFNTINQWFEPASPMNNFYKILAEYMICHHSVSTEQAVLDVIELSKMEVNAEKIHTIMRCSEPIDWRTRMYYREKVIQTLINADFDVWLLGRGWENHPSYGRTNMHILDDRVPFETTFSYMQKAKINLNVMPWFKNGTHDRIFNILLNHSLPLTDPSQWLTDNYSVWTNENDNTKGVLPMYHLDHLEELPKTVQYLLNHPSLRENMVRLGWKHTQSHFTWANLVDTLLGV